MSGPGLRPARSIPLTREECQELLRSASVGRLAVTLLGTLHVFPVNYALDEEVLVIRTRPGTKLTAARQAPVVFEVDEVDAVRRTGWSVVVRGYAEELTGAHAQELVTRTLAVDLTPWDPGPHAHWLRLVPQDVTGRRILPAEQLPHGEAAGYP